MNGPLTPDAAERLLRGEPTGPAALADLLAEAAATPVPADPVAEEAALAAFRVARLTGPRPRARRRPRLLTFKTGLLGLLLAGAGGVTAATVAAHQAEAPAHRPAPTTHQSVDSRTTGTHGAAITPPGPGGPQTATPRTTPGATPAATSGAKTGEKTNAGQGTGNGKQNGHATTKPRPTKKPKGSSKGKGHG